MPDEFHRLVQDVADGMERVVIAVRSGKHNDSEFHCLTPPALRETVFYHVAGILFRIFPRRGPISAACQLVSCDVHAKSDAETMVVFHNHFIAAVHLLRGCAGDLYTTPLEFGMERIDIVYPHIGIDPLLASGGIRGTGLAGFDASKMNPHGIAPHDGVDRRVEKIAENLEAELVPVIFGGYHHVRDSQ